MSEAATPSWELLTKHAQVLVCIARDPGIRLREIAEALGMTERAAYRIVAQLSEAAYLTRTREGRRNRYTINTELPIPDAVAHERSIGELLKIVTGAPRSSRGHSRDRREP